MDVTNAGFIKKIILTQQKAILIIATSITLDRNVLLLGVCN